MLMIDLMMFQCYAAMDAVVVDLLRTLTQAQSKRNKVEDAKVSRIIVVGGQSIRTRAEPLATRCSLSLDLRPSRLDGKRPTSRRLGVFAPHVKTR